MSLPRDLMARMDALEVEQKEDLIKAWAILHQPRVQSLHQSPPAAQGGEGERVAVQLGRYADLRPVGVGDCAAVEEWRLHEGVVHSIGGNPRGGDVG